MRRRPDFPCRIGCGSSASCKALEIPEPPGADVTEDERVRALSGELQRRWEAYRRGETTTVDAHRSIAETNRLLSSIAKTQVFDLQQAKEVVAMTVEEIIDTATKLPPEDRWRIVDELCSTLDVPSPSSAEDWLEAWLPVWERRSREIEDGTAKTVSAEEATAAVRQALRERRAS